MNHVIASGSLHKLSLLHYNKIITPDRTLQRPCSANLYVLLVICLTTCQPASSNYHVETNYLKQAADSNLWKLLNSLKCAMHYNCTCYVGWCEISNKTGPLDAAYSMFFFIYLCKIFNILQLYIHIYYILSFNYYIVYIFNEIFNDVLFDNIAGRYMLLYNVDMTWSAVILIVVLILFQVN
jgi:hypothetical protein